MRINLDELGQNEDKRCPWNDWGKKMKMSPQGQSGAHESLWRGFIAQRIYVVVQGSFN